jgi:hypothetical protein
MEHKKNTFYSYLFFLNLCVVLLSSCKDKEFFDSDYIVKNETSESIEVRSSAYVRSNGSTRLISFTDYISPTSSFVLRNIDAREDAQINNIFENIRIFKNGLECKKNELDNAYWIKYKVNDDKFTYTLSVDTTFFQ